MFESPPFYPVRVWSELVCPKVSLDGFCGLKPNLGVLKFNIGGASRGKLGPMNIGGVLRNYKGDVLLCFQNMLACVILTKHMS